jgi:hypothetical protein
LRIEFFEWEAMKIEPVLVKLKNFHCRNPMPGNETDEDTAGWKMLSGFCDEL